MQNVAFDTAVAFVLANEGSQYTADPNDRGGASRYGITLASLSSWRRTPQTPKQVSELTMDEAKQIYLVRYWQPLGLDRLGSQPLATTLLDAAVLHGPREAVLMLQHVLAVKMDGVLGPVTLAAVNKEAGADVVVGLVQMLQHRYIAIVRHDRTQARFLYGWLCRAARSLILSV